MTDTNVIDLPRKKSKQTQEPTFDDLLDVIAQEMGLEIDDLELVEEEEDWLEGLTVFDTLLSLCYNSEGIIANDNEER